MFFVLILGLSFVFTSCEDDNSDQYREILNKLDEIAKNQGGNSLADIKKMSDDALLLVTFGSTYPEPHKTYDNMLKAYRAQFPDKDIYLAFTATTTIRRWGAKTGEYFLTPDLWLTALRNAKYKTITVQSLHVIPGEEYIILRDEYVKGFKDYNAENKIDIKVSLGDALLTSQEDIKSVGNSLMKVFKSNLEKGEAVVFMGHGNPKPEYIDDVKDVYGEHGVNQCYYDIQRDMRAYEGGKYADKIFVGTVDYEPMLFDPTLEIINGKLNKKGIVNLFPLMSIAGDHANNDMAGDEDDSWKMGLKKAGYTINKDNIVLKGLADYPEILNVWIEHTKKAIAELK